MLDAQAQPAVASAQVEVAVTPGVEVARAAQRLAILAGAVFAQMMDEHESEPMGALQGAQLAEQRAHLAGAVLVDAVQAHQRIEQE